MGRRKDLGVPKLPASGSLYIWVPAEGFDVANVT